MFSSSWAAAVTFFLRNTLYNIHKHFKASKIAIALQYCAWSPMIYEGVFVAAQDFRAHMIIFFLCLIEHLTENAKNDLCFGRKVQQLFHTHNALLPAVMHSFKTEANEIMHFFPTSLWPINTSWMLKLYIYIWKKRTLGFPDFLHGTPTKHDNTISATCWLYGKLHRSHAC